MAVRLIIEDLEGSTTVVPLSTDSVTIGRKEHNTIQLTEQNVSRSHARLTYRDDGWLIEDLRSYNGVKVNGVPISGPTVLREGDLIQIADYHLTLTDDIDRQTVDIERPRAANDDMQSMAGSSADLPSVSMDDLGPAGRSATAVAAPRYEESERKKGGAVWLVVGVAALALIGGGIFLAASNKGGDETEAADKSDAAKTPPPSTSGSDSGSGPDASTGAPATTTGPVEPPPADTGEPDLVVEDGSEPAPSSDDGVVEEPEPDPVEPKPKPDSTKPKSDPKPDAPKPKVDPVQALADARKASMAGNPSQAYKLAKSAYDAGAGNEAAVLMTISACKMGSASKAKSAYKKVASKDQGSLQKVCSPLGIELE